MAGATAIADGPAILDDVRQVARDNGVDRRIRYRARVLRAQWSTPQARWTVTVQDPHTPRAA